MPRRFPKARVDGFRSAYEARIADGMLITGIPFSYETDRLPYLDTKPRTYTPDFVLPKKAGGFMYVEAKGLFTSADRTKLLLVRAHLPHADVRLLFQRASTPLRKGSPTTYADWCRKNRFPFAEGEVIPGAWLDEVAL